MTALKRTRTMREYWHDAAQYLKLQMPEDIWTLNIEPLQVGAWDHASKTLILVAPNANAREIAAIRYDKPIRRELKALLAIDITVVYTVVEVAHAH